MHRRQSLVRAHLSDELRAKVGRRAVQLRKGDKVKILRGDFAGTIAKVEEVDLTRIRTYLEGVTTQKVNGTKTRVPLHPSNLLIIELSGDDKMRQRAFERAATGKNIKGGPKK
jgi:large subunit ribosomal protein L24